MERANFAFYSLDAPGRGGENWFSDYDAFALLIGLQLMRHGWTQGFAVAVLRRVKPELERYSTPAFWDRTGRFYSTSS